MKKYIPTFYSKDIFEIDSLFFKKINTSVLLLDLDNTLDSFKTSTPSQRVSLLINKYKKEGLRPIITSNNSSSRVKNYARALDIECFSSVFKPFSFKLKRKLKKLNINLNDCVLIGDQLMTDIACGNALNIKTIYLDKLVKEDQFTTHINRLFEKPLRARLKKCGKLNYWKNNL